jgi:aminopeptidase N
MKNVLKRSLELATFLAAVLIVLGCDGPTELDEPANALRTDRYVLDVSIDFEEETLTGSCALTVRNTSQQSIREIPLLLYRTLQVNNVKDEAGNSLRFDQEVRSFRDFKKLQVNAIQVELAKPIAPGMSRIISLDYAGYLLGYTETGMGYLHDRIDPEFTIIRSDALAYPELGIPDWGSNRAAGLPSFDYELRVSVPGEYVVSNGGALVEKKADGDTLTWIYRNTKPAWRIDAAIARYEMVSDGVNRIYCFPQDKAGAERVLGVMGDVLALYTEWFGPLDDYQGFAVIEIPDGWGSQTDVTSIIQAAAAFSSEDRMYEFYHELAHLWHVVGTDPAPPRFESEGLAMFLQYMLMEQLEGKPDAVQAGIAQSIARFKERCENKPDLAKLAMIDYGKEQVTRLSYSKGMVFFALVHELMGEADFNRAVGSFYRKYNADGATVDQFVAHFKSESSANLDHLMEEWVYSAVSSDLMMNDPRWSELLDRYR